jgi:hypothetical protein
MFPWSRERAKGNAIGVKARRRPKVSSLRCLMLRLRLPSLRVSPRSFGDFDIG